MLLFQIWCKYQEAFCKLSLLCFMCLSGSHGIKVNTLFANINYFWIFLDIQITQDSLQTAVLTTTFFLWLLLPETWFSFQFCWQLSMLIHFLWLKVYVAFNDLQNLKILLCECKRRFKIGSLREDQKKDECLGGHKEFLFNFNPPTTPTTASINWNLGNANHFKPLQPPSPQLVISTWNVKPPFFYPLPFPTIQILSIDFPDLSANFDDII